MPKSHRGGWVSDNEQIYLQTETGLELVEPEEPATADTEGGEDESPGTSSSGSRPRRRTKTNTNGPGSRQPAPTTDNP